MKDLQLCRTVIGSAGCLHVSGLTYLGSHRVLDADHSDAGEAGQDLALVVPVRLSVSGGEVSVSKADGPQALRCHRLDHLRHQIVSVPRFEGFDLAAGRQDLTAPATTGQGQVTIMRLSSEQ